ncbi:MAG TPA: carboxypeptidase regulatory-like domain-containing protein [Candidatus Angelobacter sp.]|nr:carboxypeptidase regulatory-like domain-containing protein [Candidatus Angelobacter sp.]
MKPQRLLLFLICLLVLSMLTLLPAWAQTISTGSIQGTVTDPNGAVIPKAAVTITNKGTGQALKINTSGSGTFTSGPLVPGNYEVKVEAPGFQTQVTQVPVQVGVTANGNAKLTVGKASEVVEVTSTGVAINTEQPTVQGVLTTQQIENLPINGRNFLDLAQLEPGVQIQDGGNFDPTKNGFSSISFGGRFGRTARIEVDGIDISDETVGTTTQNLPASAIQEFQVEQSSLDLSTELTSSGAVNVVTRSGSNTWHGEGFYLFRDASAAADISNTQLPFQRNNFGGNLGGYIIKDKLFFFADAERLKQDLQNPVATQGPLASLASAFNSPFRETEGVAKLNWKISDNMSAFYRFSYEQNHSIRGFIQNSFQPFLNQNNTPSHVVGWDYTHGNFTHQVRFGWMKFRNGIGDASTNLSGPSNPVPNISLTIGPDLTCLTGGLDAFCSGPNLLAPQKTFQENTQIKYDGSKVWGNHIIRFGFGYNHIQGGGFAKFFALAPTVNADLSDFNPANAPFPGGAANPLNYPAQTVLMGNGQGFSSEKPAFGLPGGGLGPDNRVQWYLGDNWKFRPNLTILYGLRYIHDTGRTDSDIAPIPCSQLDPTLAGNLAAAGTPCTGNILDLFGPGLGNRVRDPGGNFAPTVGFAWSPGTSAKTVIRGGIGLYYENSIFNNNLFNRPGRLEQGLFLNEALACNGGSPLGIPLPTGGSIDTTAVCGQPIGLVADQLAQDQQQFQAAVLQAGPAVNGAFIGNTLAASGGFNGINLFAPNYQTPRSVQMNIGFQRQLGRGVVWTADYLRNVDTHTLLAIDVNHVGDARFFNKNAALAAIAGTTGAFGCGGGTDAASINCAITNGATIADFSGFGLDSGTNVCGGGAQAAGNCVRFDQNGNAIPVVPTFGGVNPQLGVNQMLFPAGRSVYNAFDTSLKANVANPFRGVKDLYWQISYSLSRYVASALDSDFVNTAIDNNNPTGSLGPNGLDRTHQFSFGGTFDFPGYIRFGVVGHVYSPLPVSLTLPAPGPGGIFVSDVTGDGSGDGSGIYPTGDLVPGTNLGAFGRDIKTGDLANFIANYNATQAGQPTPAGQVLIQNGLFTLAQLQALGAVQPTLAAPPQGEVGLGWLKTFDFRLSYPRKITESFTIEPSVSIFNAFNNSNFDLPGNTLGGVLNLASAPCNPNDPNLVGNCVGSVNSTTAATRTTRVTPGSGVFDLGAPRVFEFGLKMSF